jgi:hypothetical protein
MADFLKIYTPYANDVAARTGLDPSVVLGIIDTETSGGTRLIGNNLFGVSPGGKVAQYKDATAAAEAFITLMNSPRYAGVAAAPTPAAQAQALVKSGYNTVNPNYAGLVSSKAQAFGKQLGYEDPPAQPAAPAATPAQTRINQELDPSQAPGPLAGPPIKSPIETSSLVVMDETGIPRQITGDAQPTTAPASGAGPERRIADATIQGWQNTEPALTPKGEAAVGPIGSFFSSALLDNPRRAFNALMAGGSAGVMEATAPITAGPEGGQDAGPGWGARLGRDINMLAQVAPVYHAAPLEVRAPPRPAEPPPARPDVPPGPYPEIPPGGWRLRPEGAPDPAAPPVGPVAPDFIPPGATPPPVPLPEPPAFVPPGAAREAPAATADAPTAGGPQPGMGGPQPQAAGAAPTPRSQAGITTEEAARARTVADKEWFNTTQQPGVLDTRELIPGIIPTLVEQEQSVVRARELKALRNQDPEVSQSERELLDSNSELRKRFYNETAGSDVTRGADLKAAGDKIEADLARAWSNKGEANPAGIQTQIAAELDGSAGHLPPVKSAMQQVSDSLEKAGTDPEAMYRTRRLINYLQSREGQTANPGYGDADVQAALTRTKKAVDAAIEPAAPGFKQAMSDYAAVAGPADAGKELQERELKLYDNQGRMSYPAVHSLMRDVIKAQNWDAPNHPLQFVSDEQMSRLKTLHDDLKRVASAQDLAQARGGSDTAPNVVDIIKNLATGPEGKAALHAAAGAFAGPVGNAAVWLGGKIVPAFMQGRTAARNAARAQEILRPDRQSELTPYNNPLLPRGPDYNPLVGTG